MTVSRLPRPEPARNRRARGAGRAQGEEAGKPNPAFRIGIVRIRQTGERAWLVRYRDPLSRQDVRRQFQGLEAKEVRAMAAHISQEALAGRGYLPGKRETAPTIEEAIVETLHLSGARETTRQDMARRARSFVHWLAEHHPSAMTWDQLRPAMIQAYVRDCERAGLARDSIRLRLLPIRQTWRYAAENFPDLVRPLPVIRLPEAPPSVIECLDPGEVAALLDWLKVRRPSLWPIACLQALCGLRILEATALRTQDVNLESRTIRITDTGVHKPKTRDSYRTLPICDEVAEALSKAMASQKVRPPTGEIFSGRTGDPLKKRGISRSWTRAIRTASRQLDCPRLAKIPARKLRAAFATMASRLEAPDRLLRAYMGHAAGDMLGGHYLRIELRDLKAVSDRMNQWREAGTLLALPNNSPPPTAENTRES